MKKSEHENVLVAKPVLIGESDNFSRDGSVRFQSLWHGKDQSNHVT